MSLARRLSCFQCRFRSAGRLWLSDWQDLDLGWVQFHVYGRRYSRCRIIRRCAMLMIVHRTLWNRQSIPTAHTVVGFGLMHVALFHSDISAFSAL